jgi:hypothetical protein
MRSAAAARGDAGALEHEHHAEERCRVAPVEQVVGVGDHHLGRQLRIAGTHRRGVATGRGDVVEDPFLVADLLRDVLGDRAPQPCQALRQTAAEVINSGVVCRTW